MDKVKENKDDKYNAGPCPVCGEFAIGTWRTPGAPVFCVNGHKWYRNTKIVAKSNRPYAQAVGVHESHCCVHHGCKYGDSDCPVVLGLVKQKYPCEDCGEKINKAPEELKGVPFPDCTKMCTDVSRVMDDISIDPTCCGNICSHKFRRNL